MSQELLAEVIKLFFENEIVNILLAGVLVNICVPCTYLSSWQSKNYFRRVNKLGIGLQSTCGMEESSFYFLESERDDYSKMHIGI